MTSEIRLSLKIFESVVGNKPLEGLTRDDFQQFVAHLASQQVGGKTAGSISRPVSAATVKKRLGILNAAINHADHRGWFSGKIRHPISKLAHSCRKVDKSIMQISAGLPSRTKQDSVASVVYGLPIAHANSLARSASSHGMPFLGPYPCIDDGLQGRRDRCLKISEIKLNDPNPHLVITPNEFRSIKNNTARYVPILDCLIDLGFANFVGSVQKSGAIRLFLIGFLLSRLL